jgi:hypothetical protein
MLILATRFIVEVLGVATLAWLGASAPVEHPANILLAIGAPAALVVTWGLVVAPKAANPLPLRVRELLGTGLLLGVAGGLALAGQLAPAVAYGAVVLVDQLLLVALGPGTAVAARHASPAA